MLKSTSVFVMLHLSLIFAGFMIGGFSTSLPLIQGEFLFSDTEMGFLGSLNLWGMMIGALVFGVVADRIGRKKLIIMALFVGAVMNSLIFFANDFAVFALLRLLTGVGIGAITPLSASLLSEYLTAKTRTFMLTILMTGIPIGQLLVATTGIIILDFLPWRFLFLFSLVACLLLPLMMRYLPETLSKAGDKKTTLAEAGEALDSAEDNAGLFVGKRLRNLLLLFVVFFCNLYVFYGVSTWLPGLMAIQGFALVSGLIFLVAFLVGNISLPIFAGSLINRLGYKKIMFIAYIILVTMIFLLSLGIDGVWGFPLVFLIGGSVGVVQNMVVAIAPNFFPSRLRGSAIGICSAGSRVGSALAPIIVGFLIAWQLQPAGIFLTFIIPAIIAMIALLLTCPFNQRNI